MWNHYAEEKVREFQAREIEKKARLKSALERPRTRRATADTVGRVLVELGTRLQRWARQPSSPDPPFAGAEE